MEVRVTNSPELLRKWTCRLGVSSWSLTIILSPDFSTSGQAFGLGGAFVDALVTVLADREASADIHGD